MSLPTNEFIVAALEGDVVKRYYAIDRDIGANFSEYFSSAHHFKNLEEAVSVLQSIQEKAKDPKAPDREGVIYPQSEVCQALGLHSDRNPEGKATLAVFEFRLHQTHAVEIQAKIKKPTGFTYD